MGTRRYHSPQRAGQAASTRGAVLAAARTVFAVSERRARDMREFAADLRATGELRDGLTDDDVADAVWSMNAAEYWDLLVGRRGWSPDRFAGWLADTWTRTFLR
jgi:hypothetical protein